MRQSVYCMSRLLRPMMVIMIASGRSMLEQRAFMFFLFRIHICQIIDVTYPQTRIDSLSMIYLCFGLLFLCLYHLWDKVFHTK